MQRRAVGRFVLLCVEETEVQVVLDGDPGAVPAGFPLAVATRVVVVDEADILLEQQLGRCLQRGQAVCGRAPRMWHAAGPPLLVELAT
jgi:hypothetical protein